MLFLLIVLRTKQARPAESFTDLATGMFVANYPCSSNFGNGALLEKVREMYCLFHPQI